jgi:hypothetical protein
MIKNCIIYKYSDEFKDGWDVDKRRFSQSTLGKCLQKAEGFTRRTIESFKELSKNEKLSLEKNTKSHYVANLSCEFRAQKFIAAGEIIPPFIPVNFDIWLRKKSSWVISFDAGRKLSGVAIALLSYATTGNPSSIKHIKLEKGDFLQLKNQLLSEDHEISGQIKRITMHNTKYDSVKFKQIVLSAPQLEESKLFNRLTDSALGISNLSFTTPPIKSTSRSLNCKINRWGGIAIYTPNLLDSEISELITILEGLYAKQDSRVG